MVNAGLDKRPWPLLETARVVGGYRWVELRLFEIMGRWVQQVPEPEVKLHLATESFHHSWHADLFFGVLPVTAAVDRDGVTAAPTASFPRLIEAVAAPVGADTTIEKLVGVYRVLLPHLIRVLNLHRERCVGPGSASLVRCLDLVLRDELGHWQEGDLLLHTMLTDSTSMDRAVRHQGALEQLLVEAGGLSAHFG